MNRYWIAVASADHARRGHQAGFMQVCYGKGGPLRRLRAGDGIV
jgi:EVE domain